MWSLANILFELVEKGKKKKKKKIFLLWHKPYSSPQKVRGVFQDTGHSFITVVPFVEQNLLAFFFSFFFF